MSKLVIEVQALLHLIIQAKANVFIKIFLQRFAWQTEKPLVVGNDLSLVCHTFVTRCGKVDPSNSIRGRIAKHPHSKNESEASVVSP